MSYSEPARTTARRIPRIPVAGLLVVLAAIAAALGYQLVASSSWTAPSSIDVLSSEHRGAFAPYSEQHDAPTRGSEQPGAPAFRTEQRGALVAPGQQRGAHGDADGAVPDGTTVFDDEIPGVANLDPALLGALRQAATDAAGDRVEFFVNSGWRSAKYQEQLLREAISKYGSEKEAARWVATPHTSPHVSGDAVDIGPSAAAGWLSKRGAEYGLCQIYKNEPWHYELRPEAIAHGCPRMYADPTHDPRMQQ
jgi:D-alanyl-D-alanine carboxypeptidase